MDEFLRQFRAQYPGAYDAMPDDELAQAIYRKFYASKMEFEEFAARVGAKHGTQADDPASTGPTRQPPFAAIDKGVDVPGLGRVSLGGGLDFLRSMVLPVTEPFNTAGGDMRQANLLAELRGRSSGATDAGALAGSVLAGGGVTSHLRQVARTARTASKAQDYFRASRRAAQGIPPAATPVRDLLKNRWLWGAGGGALEYLRRKVMP